MQRLVLRRVLVPALALLCCPSMASLAQPGTKPGPVLRLPAPKPVATQLPDGRIMVRWPAVVGAATYQIVRSVPPTPAQKLAQPDPADTVYFDSDVRAGSTYYYEISAVDESGAVGLKGPAQAVAAAISGSGTTASTPAVTPLAPPTAVAAVNFPYPHATVHWSFPRGGVYFIVERAVASSTGKGAFQLRQTTPGRPCCIWSVIDLVNDVALGTGVVYRVTAVDPATPTNRSAPVEAAEIRVTANWYSPNSITQYLEPGHISDRTLPVGSPMPSGMSPNLPHFRAVSLDEAIVTVDARGVITAKAPGVAYVVIADMRQHGQVVTHALRITVTP